MKLKLTRDEGFLLEDALLDVFYGLDASEHEGNPDLGALISRLQDKLFGEISDGV